jgi:dTDP-glucose pyrophosphorylase
MRLANYIGRDLDNLCVREDQSLRKTMEIMSKAGLRLAPVLKTDGTFAGVAADGDLRRYIAQGGGLDDPVGKATNRNPSVIDAEVPLAEVRSTLLRRGLEYMPRVQDGRLEALHVLWVASSAQQLTAVIMAGGLGTRLAPLTDNCPKPLLTIGERPILTHIIEHLRDQGVTRFILSVNYLSEMIVNHFGDGSELDVSVEYVHEKMRMGTGGALGLIDPAALSDPFLCLNGDVLNDIDVGALESDHRANAWDATMVVREHSYTVPYGVVKTGQNGAFDHAEEKPTVYFNINAGIYMLSKSVLSLVPRGASYDMPTLFADLNTRSMHGGTYKHGGRWIDIGNMSEFERAKSIYEGHRK